MKRKTPCLARQAGELLVAGFDGTEPSKEILALIRAGLGGVILYRKNCVDATQVLELTNRLQDEARAAGHAQPLSIAIDRVTGMATMPRHAATWRMRARRSTAQLLRAERRVLYLRYT